MTASSHFAPQPGSLARCYLFVGNDPVLMSEALGRLRLAALGEDDSPDQERLEVPRGLRGAASDEESDVAAPAEGSIAAEVISAANTPSLFGERRLVVLRHALRLDATSADQLAKALPGLPEFACVAIVCDPIPDVDFRAADRLSSVEQKLVKAAEKAGQVVSCTALKDDSGRQGLIELARERGYKLSGSAASLLWALSGKDFLEARAQLEKVFEYAESTDEVTEEDVQASVLGAQKANVFGFVDAVTDGKIKDALKNLDVILSSRDKEEEAALQVVLPQLTRQFRLLWQARLLMDQQVGPAGWRNLAGDERLPREHNLAQSVSRQEWMAKKYATLARRYPPNAILDAMDLIARADMAMKGMEAGVSVSDILGRLVLSLCALRDGA